MNSTKNPLLIEPNADYQKSFINYVLAYQRINDQHYFDKYKKALEDFPGYLQYLKNGSLSNDPNQAETTTSTFWLIDENEVVGVIRIRLQADDFGGHIGYDISPDYRHQGYGYIILKLGILKARELGIHELTITCNVENKASRKIIEKCHGQLKGTVYDKDENEHLYQFIISTP